MIVVKIQLSRYSSTIQFISSKELVFRISDCCSIQSLSPDCTVKCNTNYKSCNPPDYIPYNKLCHIIARISKFHNKIKNQDSKEKYYKFKRNITLIHSEQLTDLLQCILRFLILHTITSCHKSSPSFFYYHFVKYICFIIYVQILTFKHFTFFLYSPLIF